MSLDLFIEVVLLLFVLAGLYSYRVYASFREGGNILAAISAILLFLLAAHVIHL